MPATFACVTDRPNSSPNPRDAGRRAVHSLRRGLADKVIRSLADRDPEFLAGLTEIGVVSREYVEDKQGPMSTAAPIEVVERLLQRSVERRPSLLASLGLSTIQVLSSAGEEDERSGVPVPLTVAFTDLEGFTRFTAKEGDEAASELLARHHQVVGPVVRSRGGRVVKRLGDGLLLTFPAAEAAVLSCLELVDGQPEPLRLRAGVHTGDVVIVRDDVVGHVVNVAARVAESAKGGEVLVTTELRDQVADGLPRVRFGRTRTRHFKGIGHPVRVCPAVWAPA